MRYIILFLAGLLLPLSIHAQSRQLDAHEHGAAKVMMAMEGKMLQLQFEVPSDSLIGFEYSPESEKDRKVFAYAMTILSNPTNLFDIPDEAECIPVGIKVSQTYFPEKANIMKESIMITGMTMMMVNQKKIMITTMIRIMMIMAMKSIPNSKQAISGTVITRMIWIRSRHA